MHELGLVNYVVKEVGKIAEEQDIKKINSVTLEFGEVSGIVTSYLYDYWDWYTKKFPLFDGSELKCEEIPAVTWCDDCKITYSTVKYGKTCPNCGSGKTWLLRGNEMNIKEVEVYDEDAEGDQVTEVETNASYVPGVDAGSSDPAAVDAVAPDPSADVGPFDPDAGTPYTGADADHSDPSAGTAGEDTGTEV